MSEWLNVSATAPRIAYTATAGQTAFTIPFVFFENADLFVYRNGLLLTLATHYTVTGAESETGGVLTLLTASTVGDAIMIVRDVEIAQTTHIPPSGPLDIPAVNIQISKLIAIDQQLADDVSRSLRVPDSLDVPGGLRTTTPVPGEFLKWNAAGDGVESAVAVEPPSSGGVAYAVATQSEAVAGTLNTVLMTPLRTAQSLPVVLAWQNGVPGDTGADLTAPLQAIVDSLPQGGTIYLRGRVKSSLLDLHGKSNLTFKGADAGAQVGTGYSIRATLEMTTGAVGARNPAIKAWGSQNIAFEDLWLYATSAAFDGSLLDYGGPAPVAAGGEAIWSKIRNCILSTSSASSTCLAMVGVTNAAVRDTNFTGPGTHVLFPNSNYAVSDFANMILFDNCAFLPSGTLYPVFGSGASVTFLNCLWEPCSDGLTRAIQTSSNRPFAGLTLINPMIIDAYNNGGIAVILPWGEGFVSTGGFGGAPAGQLFLLGGGGNGSGGGAVHADPELRGLRGVSISGMVVNGVSSMIYTNGLKADKTNIRGIKVFGNSVVVGIQLAFLTAVGEIENGEFGPNNTYGLPHDPGTSKFLVGWPTYANYGAAIGAGLVAGQEFINSSLGGGGSGVRQIV